ncbi:uncharacterized protein DSM5745_00346 [Aspergillus mulundensis]|uniref:Protein kinase domain-containing protein n=1 Tax=Aspergillus mulundensis TaxID=1810919 RepID=A0A3D8T396_9EURO|nr:hypothetical protein DSM5745_00346 [Aspergillus mulundensis]RDW93024.1 hypothetical protein DSM5745_00346 [Aspergillus mulundensis]
MQEASVRTSLLPERRLETTFDSTGDRHHGLGSDKECWRAIRTVGEGSFGSVWQESCISGPSKGAVRAVKHLHKRQARFLELSERELNALVTFSDPADLNFLGWFEDAQSFYIAMEFIQHGDLQQYITEPFPEPEAALIVAQVAQALLYMHEKEFIHRDVKPLYWHVKLADFGISKTTDISGKATYNVGTPGYMAPELHDDSVPYDAAVDIWALGAVAYCLRAGHPPFRNTKQVLSYAGNPEAQDYRSRFPIEPIGSSSYFFTDFVLGTMADLPGRRLGIEGVLAHRWVSGKLVAPSCSDVSVDLPVTSSMASLTIANSWASSYDDADDYHERSDSPATPTTDSEIGAASQAFVANRAIMKDGSRIQPSGVAVEMDLTIENLDNLEEDLAHALDIRDYYRAEFYSNRLVTTLRGTLGNTHQETINALAQLAGVYRAGSNFEQAQLIYYEVVSLRCSVLGENDLATLSAMESLAMAYREDKKFDMALAWYDKLVDVVGWNHPDTNKYRDARLVVRDEQSGIGQPLTMYQARIQVEGRLSSIPQ